MVPPDAGLRRRVLIIVNPAAGRGARLRRKLARVVVALERLGCDVVLRHTEPGRADAERLAREAESSFDIIVAAGGDGTINAVVNGADPSRPLGLLPLGTANVLAHDLGLPFRPEQLAELVARGVARPLWPGLVGERQFVAMAGCGFDAAIVAAVNPRLKRRLGRIAFAWAILCSLARYRSHTLVVRGDGFEYVATAVIAAKGRFYAGPYVIAPAADLAEPMLDLVLFQRSGRAAVLSYLASLLLGRLPRRRDIVFLRCSSAVVSTEGSVLVEADGEVIGRLPVSLGVADRPIALVRP
jgi:diacylglycerol kinase (ATP)